MKSLASLTLLCLATSLPMAEPISWEAIVYPKNQLFPSLLATTATINRQNETLSTWEGDVLGDAFGAIGTRVRGLRQGQKVRLELAPNDIIEASSWEGSVPHSTEEWLIFPTLVLKYAELISCNQTRPLTLKMTLHVDDKRIGENTQIVTLRSINDCLFAVQDNEDDESSVIDFTWLFAGYVNEGHPWIDEVLRTALDLGIINQFDGYQSGDPEMVLAQVYAIWRTMQEKGLKYSDITATSAEAQGVYSQHVRLLDESINSRQANCVDGSVLLTSILRKIGINSYLVLVPGHMFMAFDLDQEGESHLALETTLLGATDLPSIEKNENLPDKLLQEHKDEESMSTFLAALETATKVLEENAGAFEDENNPLYQYIDIAIARQNGILPIGYKQKN